ncbi:MAG: ATP-dependent helicase [Anaerolineae bacterium]|nr:ATP-dependent helicase [Anaerolineae bacterium]
MVEAKLRPAQEAVLAYSGGQMAISAVPGSGKTYTLALLAARLIASGQIDVAGGQQVLIVTYLNASVETFRARIRQHLQEAGAPLQGFDVRTLHSLGLEIVRAARGSDNGDPIAVVDEAQASGYLAQAVSGWIEAHPEAWRAFLPDAAGVQMRARWREITERTAQVFIRTAKNERYPPVAVERALREQASTLPDPATIEDQTALDSSTPDTNLALLWMLNGIYGRYQAILARQGALDFDDLIAEAVRLMESQPDLVAVLRQRWPYVLEDEAQDSVPLQEVLLGMLAGAEGNWVRVGDPNQAITSTFTAAHPRYFNAFLGRPGVAERPLPNSGRSAPRIMALANHLIDWASSNHPVAEVRQGAFRRQRIEPTPPGDSQPNPEDFANNIRIKVYEQREEGELPAVGELAYRYVRTHPEQTAAILVPTNRVGYAMAEELDRLDAPYDNLLRGGVREREVASALQGILALLADPLDTRALVLAHEALVELGHPAAGAFELETEEGRPTEELARIQTLLRSTHQPERLLFPRTATDVVAALPATVASEEEIARLQPFLALLQKAFALRSLPVDDLTLALADELFAVVQPDGSNGHSHEFDLSVAYQIANLMRQWRDLEPRWRLPELATQLAEVAAGRRLLPGSGSDETGYEPRAGRISLATQHGAKGLEWDAVFLVGVDGLWIPGSLDAPFLGVHDFLGGDPTAEAAAQLHALMEGDAGLYPGRSATESAHIEVISERLRLLYVGITRARRYLHISRSRRVRRYRREERTEAAEAVGALYRFLHGDDGRRGAG